MAARLAIYLDRFDPADASMPLAKRLAMSVISIKTRFNRIEGDRGVCLRPVVVIFPGRSDNEASAKAGVASAADAPIIRMLLGSASAA